MLLFFAFVLIHSDISCFAVCLFLKGPFCKKSWFFSLIPNSSKTDALQLRLQNLFFLLNRSCGLFLVFASFCLSWLFGIYCDVVCPSNLRLLYFKMCSKNYVIMCSHFYHLVTCPLAWAPGWELLQQVNVWPSVRGYKLQLTAISQICGLCDQRLRALLSSFTRQQLSLCETGLRLSGYFCQHCHLWPSKLCWGCFLFFFSLSVFSANVHLKIPSSFCC